MGSVSTYRYSSRVFQSIVDVDFRAIVDGDFR